MKHRGDRLTVTILSAALAACVSDTVSAGIEVCSGSPPACVPGTLTNDAMTLINAGQAVTVSDYSATITGGAGTGVTNFGALVFQNASLTANTLQLGQANTAPGPGVNPSALFTGSQLTLAGGLNVYAGKAELTSSTLNGNATVENSAVFPAGPLPTLILNSNSVVNGNVSAQYGGQVQLTSSMINSTGGSAIRTAGSATINLSLNSTITGGVSGIQVVGNSSETAAPLATIAIDSSTVKSTNGPAIDLAAAPKTQTTTITASNSSSLIGSNGQIVNVESSYLGAVNLSIDHSLVSGNIVSAGLGPVDVALTNGTVLRSTMTGVDSVNISSSVWILNGSSNVPTITASSGTLFAPTSQLTAGTLSGTGTMAGGFAQVVAAPAFVINGRLGGTWTAEVTDVQHNFMPGQLQNTYLIAKVLGPNTATISGTSDLGAFQYKTLVGTDANIYAVLDRYPFVLPTGPGPAFPPTDEPGGGGGGAPEGPPVLNDGAVAAVDALSVATTKAMWDTQFSALHLREQNLRDFAPTQYSLWVQGYGGDYKLSDGYSATGQNQFDDSVTGMAVGADMVLHRTDDSQIYGGLFISFIGEDRSTSGSSGTSHGNAFGVYGTWQHITGWYVEGMAAYGTLQNGYTANYYGDPLHPVVNANQWDARSMALAVEVGKKFELPGAWIIQPAIGARYLHQNGQSLTTDIGNNVTAGSVNSSGVNASLTFSKIFYHNDQQYRPYLRVGYADEFAGTQTINYAGYSIDSKLDTTRGFLNCGVEALIAKRHSLFLDFQYQDGHNMQNTYLVNGGYRYTF